MSQWTRMRDQRHVRALWAKQRMPNGISVSKRHMRSSTINLLIVLFILIDASVHWQQPVSDRASMQRWCVRSLFHDESMQRSRVRYGHLRPLRYNAHMPLQSNLQ